MLNLLLQYWTGQFQVLEILLFYILTNCVTLKNFKNNKSLVGKGRRWLDSLASIPISLQIFPKKFRFSVIDTGFLFKSINDIDTGLLTYMHSGPFT